MTPPKEQTMLSWTAHIALAIALLEVLILKFGGLLKLVAEQAALWSHATCASTASGVMSAALDAMTR